MSAFSSKKTQQGVYAAEEAKEKTQTEAKQKASSRNTQKELQGIRGESKKLLLRLNLPHGIHLPPAY